MNVFFGSDKDLLFQFFSFCVNLPKYVSLFFVVLFLGPKYVTNV